MPKTMYLKYPKATYAIESNILVYLCVSGNARDAEETRGRWLCSAHSLRGGRGHMRRRTFPKL